MTGADVPKPIHGRAGRVQVHHRDTLKSTATQAVPVSVYSRLVEHLVESSAVMAAGATVLTTSTGEDLGPVAGIDDQPGGAVA